MTTESGNARVLAVEDVRENVRLLEAVLAPRGYQVFSATDGSTPRAPSRSTGTVASRPIVEVTPTREIIAVRAPPCRARPVGVC